MNQKEKLALFLGMLSGDGCLSIKHNGEGYRDYPIDFCNNREELVKAFDDLFFQLFSVRGNIYSRLRPGRQRIWNFQKYSVDIVNYLKKLGFPEGVKRDVLKVLPVIKDGNDNEKLYFIQGMIVTDGYFTKSMDCDFILEANFLLKIYQSLFMQL